jgi:hypothetical protein
VSFGEFPLAVGRVESIHIASCSAFGIWADSRDWVSRHREEWLKGPTLKGATKRHETQTNSKASLGTILRPKEVVLLWVSELGFGNQEALNPTNDIELDEHPPRLGPVRHTPKALDIF